MFKGRIPNRVAGYLAAAVAGVLVGAGGLAFAASSGGVLHACASKGTGILRLASRCTMHERAVKWNAQGPQGVQGPRGLVGQQGPAGKPGQLGPAGPSYGDSAFFIDASAGLCTLATVAQLPITLTTPSEIFASMSGNYFLNGGTASEGEFEVELRDAGDTTTVAVLPTYSFDISPSNVFDVPFASDGVLRSGTDPNAPGASAYVAQPGSYLLKWLAGGFGNCDSPPGISYGSMTYSLLGTSP